MNDFKFVNLTKGKRDGQIDGNQINRKLIRGFNSFYVDLIWVVCVTLVAYIQFTGNLFKRTRQLTIADTLFLGGNKNFHMLRAETENSSTSLLNSSCLEFRLKKYVENSSNRSFEYDENYITE